MLVVSMKEILGHAFKECYDVPAILKRAYMKSNLTFLCDAEAKDKWEPPSLFNAVCKGVIEKAKGYKYTFGSEGKAW